MLAVARRHLPDGVVLTGAEASRGPPMIVDPAALAAAAEEVVRIGAAAAGTVDGIVVAAFGDPGLASLRRLVPIPVVGIGEAAINEAAQDGRRFGIATTTPALVPAIAALVEALGCGSGFTGVRVPDAEPLRLAANPAAQDRALAEAATRCIEEDGAESVVIGGGPLSSSAARLRAVFAVPIIEPVPAGLRRLLRKLGA